MRGAQLLVASARQAFPTYPGPAAPSSARRRAGKQALASWAQSEVRVSSKLGAMGGGRPSS